MIILNKLRSIIILLMIVFCGSCDSKREALGASNEIRVICSELDKPIIRDYLSSIFTDTLFTPEPEPYYYLKFSDHQKALLEASENNANETILAEPSINMNQAVRSYKRENSATNTAFIMMEDNTSLPITGAFIVGKGKDSNVVLDGWFAPKVSFIVDQKVDGYYITSMDNKVKVNGEAVKSLQKLSSRDLISVRGKKFQVHLSYKK